ncbi:hypothetical protein LTR70_009502 [Exophiala xenobiotica]|uniref:Uncharacterized protein n=1 Tax=Lithohypha guttulata TaxID=1690604 RepID=A0ABR0JX31_9EURO|nr:hypothetical protein LTR24_009412 [Lithohypha guttulata]KAK5310396.1 hypothetical protein LTR70_009502 [Exophiala xenobiotica]
MLHYFRELIESYEEAKSGDRSPIKGHELFGTRQWSSTPSLSRDPTLFTTSNISSLWGPSPNALPSMTCYPPSSSYGILAGPDPTVATNNDLPQFMGTEYFRQPMSNLTCLGWAAALPNHRSHYPFVGNSGSQPGTWDSGSVYHDPYMQNFWPTETTDSGRMSNNQDNVHTQYG